MRHRLLLVLGLVLAGGCPGGRPGDSPGAWTGRPADEQAAGALPFKLYPLPGLFGLTDAPSGDRSLLEKGFVDAIGPTERDYFAARFRTAFPESVEQIDDANKRRTFTVSLQVIRASYYSVPKPAIRSVDVLLPMTASLYFTNVLTGEVLLSTTRTLIPGGTLAEANARPDSPRVAELYRHHLRELIDDLVTEARKRFRPRSITATVQKEWKGLAILDAGTESGLQKDDSLQDAEGNELRVEWSAPGYSVARADLGKFKAGKVFSRVSNGTLAEIQRPRLLPLIDKAPSEMPPAAIVQLFADLLGDAAPVSLMPVNPTFAAVLQAVSEKAQISQDEVRARALPEMFIRLRADTPVSFELPTDKAHRRRRLTEATALAEVQDASGRVLFATVARNRVEDTIIDGMKLDLANRREVVLKNALLELARKFGAGFKPRSIALPVGRPSGDTFPIGDPHGLLAAKDNFWVFRSVGRINKTEAWAPVWQGEVVGPLAGGVTGRTILPVVQGEPGPKAGDRVLFKGVDTPVPTRRRFGPCGHAEKLGAIDLPDYEVLALNQFAAAYPAPYYAPGLPEQVRARVNEASGFQKALEVHEPAIDLCVQPVYRIDPLPQSCKNNMCADTVSVRLTYRIRQGGAQGEVKAKQGLETRMTATALPVSSGAEERGAALRLDLIDEVLKLTPRLAAGLAKEPL
jgi:hypothetical protein